MRTFVSNLTAAMLLVHALVGCCRDHNHNATTCDRTELSDSLASGCCHGDHATSSHENERPIAPCDCKLACKALCISLPPGKSLIDARQSTLCIDIVAFAPTAATLHTASADSYWNAGSGFHVSGPPLRLHLLHQVILI